LIIAIGYINDKRKRIKIPGTINKISPILIKSIERTVNKNMLLNKDQAFWKAFFQDFVPFATSIEATIQKENTANIKTLLIIRV